MTKKELMERPLVSRYNFQNISKNLEGNLNRIAYYNKIKFIGYLTSPLIFGLFLVKQSNEKLNELKGQNNEKIALLEEQLAFEFEELNKRYKDIEKADTYLVYKTKNSLLNDISLFLKSLDFWIDKENLLPIEFVNFSKKQREEIYHIQKDIENYNPEFVKTRKTNYKSLFKKDSLVLDDEQQTAIVTDDTHNLVVAGAGSGKTEVLITRVAYLVKREPDTIKPERILVLAFQNKAANELKERLEKRYKISSNVPNEIEDKILATPGKITIGTFHALGKKILEDAYRLKGKNAPKLKDACSNEKEFRSHIETLFTAVSENQGIQSQIVNFMKHYGDSEVIKEEADFKEKEEYYKYQRGLTYIALDGTQVRSKTEREILNFFIANNLNGRRIVIEYEKSADWMKHKDKDGKPPKPDFYFPKFDIWLEHWAIGKSGKVPDWFSGRNPTEKYKADMESKKQEFKKEGKFLVETTEAEFENGEFEVILKNKFMSALKKKYPDEFFEITPVPYTELVERVWDDCKSSVKGIAISLSSFIVIAKTYGLSPEEVAERLETGKWSPKQRAFGVIANKIYELYEKGLRKNNEIDFSDMINLAVSELKKQNDLYRDVYDHILIDEYQDISTQRYELVRLILEKNPRCKLFCVGDDWQSIMGFAGSNLDFFINFGKYFSNPAITYLTRNYRSIRSIVDLGTNIIKENDTSQIKKKIVSNNSDSRQICVYSSMHGKKFYKEYYKQIAEHCVDKIKEYYDKGEYTYEDFMILLRISAVYELKKYITDYARKLNIPISEENLPRCVRIMSVHKSKGLQAKVVILLNVTSGLYGFPCELENPEIFEPVIKNNDGLREEEERRLFYVAVTRAKEDLIIYTQNCSESKFITELNVPLKKEPLNY